MAVVVRRFEDLRAWKKAKELALAVYKATEGGRFGRDFGLRDQIRRAAVSVMSNIAEGFDRYSRAEFRHFLSIARGSVSEVRSQLHLAHELVADDRVAAQHCPYGENPVVPYPVLRTSELADEADLRFELVA